MRHVTVLHCGILQAVLSLRCPSTSNRNSTKLTLRYISLVGWPVIRCREQDALQHIADLQAELRVTSAQLSEQQAEIHDLNAAVESLEAHAAALEQRAAAAEAAHAAEIGRSTALQQQQQQELKAARNEQQDLLKQHQVLMDSLAKRDQQVWPGNSVKALCCHYFAAMLGAPGGHTRGQPDSCMELQSPDAWLPVQIVQAIQFAGLAAVRDVTATTQQHLLHVDGPKPVFPNLWAGIKPAADAATSQCC